MKKLTLIGIISGVTATLDALTIANGRVSGSRPIGGGILNNGTLTLTNSTLSGNSASGGSSAVGGCLAWKTPKSRLDF